MTYQEKLSHPNWQKLSARIKEAAGWKCEDCGRKDKNLQTHKTAYISGREIWEYPTNLYMCLCDDCHQKRQKLEDGFRVALGEITRFLPPQQLEAEVWRILQAVRLRETERLAGGFSA